VRRRAGPGSVLIAVAAWLLALTGGGALFVSFSAQYAYIFAVRRQDAASVIEALLLDLLMIVFTLLALGLSGAGKSARAERALILACAAASAYMNVSAADVASPRSVTAYAIAPVALAMVVDRVVAVIRRHALADREPSAWSTVGRAAAAAARIAGLLLLYALRFALAAPETARGLRRMVLDAAPLPGLPGTPAPEAIEPPRTKKAVLLALYRAHPDYGNRSRASRVAAELAPQAGLQPGTARSYLYAELDGRAS
jgi:signal transduction histidine kinase